MVVRYSSTMGIREHFEKMIIDEVSHIGITTILRPSPSGSVIKREAILYREAEAEQNVSLWNVRFNLMPRLQITEN